MNFALILKLIHILTAIWMIAGLIGRAVTLDKAGKSKDIREVTSLLGLSEIFERRMVIPGSAAVLIVGLVTALAAGWPILGFLQGGASNWVLVSFVLFLTIMPVIRFIFVPRGKVFEAAYKDSVLKERITPELDASFRDPVVRAAHLYEGAVVAIIIALMVLKPF